LRALGLDLGSTSIKGCLWQLVPGRPPRLIQQASRPSGLGVPQAGWAVHDPHQVLSAARAILEELPTYDCLGFSSAMHSLLPLCETGQPLMAALSWADQRAWKEADELASAPQAPAWAERTGTPIHPMGWPAKWLWLRRQGLNPCRVVGLKEWVVAQLAGLDLPPWMDRSLASATGLYTAQGWDEELLERVGLHAHRLPQVIEPDQPLPQFSRRVVLGAGDGPLSQLGVGAVDPDQACLSIGTSGALRQMCSATAATEGGRWFRYYLSRQRWVRGGAISNGSLVLDWLCRLQGSNPEAMLNSIEGIPPGSDGLVALPYLVGERSPHWDARARGVYLGLSLQHGPAHLARAMLEGVIFALQQVYDGLSTVEEIRATGGMSRSPVWMQMLADALGRPVLSTSESEAGALGAALLAAGIEVVPEVLQRFTPRPEHREAYARAYATYRELYPALRQIMHAQLSCSSSSSSSTQTYSSPSSSTSTQSSSSSSTSSSSSS